MIRIIIADRHPLVREGLKRIFGAAGALSIVAEASTLDELWHHMQQHNVDVLIGENSFLSGKAFEILKEVKKRVPHVAMVVFSIYLETCYVAEAFRGGAMAYVTKTASADEIIMAIHRAVSGKHYVDSALRNRSTDQSWDLTPGEHQDLSPREFEVLQLIVEGKRNREIAELLNVSAKTVSTHRAHILEKMDLTTNQQIVRYVLQRRLAVSPTTRQVIPA
jgi:two-component system, NarL family, invasion response regulator UvrY